MTKQELRAERDELRETVERLRLENTALRERNGILEQMVRATLGPEPVLVPSIWTTDPADGWPSNITVTSGVHTMAGGPADD